MAIRGLILQSLRMAELPIFTEVRERFYTLDIDFRDLHAERWRWVVRYPFGATPKAIVPTNIDMRIDLFALRLREWIASIGQLQREETDPFDVDVIFSVRGIGDVPNYGRLITAGLAVFAHQANASPIDPADLFDVIFRFCTEDRAQRINDMHGAIRDAYERMMETRRETQRRFEEQQEAKRRSIDLLRRCLNPTQRAHFDRFKSFWVNAPDGYRYKIKTNDFAHNIERVDERGKPLVRYCIVTEKHVPLHDQVLAQKLILESEPDVFHSIANFEDVARAPRRRRHA